MNCLDLPLLWIVWVPLRSVGAWPQAAATGSELAAGGSAPATPAPLNTRVAAAAATSHRTRRRTLFCCMGFRTLCQEEMAQVLPLRENEAGAEVLPVCVAWKPMLIDALGAMSGL